jgi:stearoyl-CoA desaturase (Delta-9 desaturase)
VVATLAVIAFSAVAVKLLRGRLPGVVYRSLVAAAFFLPLAATVYAMWRLWGDLIDWTELALFLSFYAATGFGVSIGFHRLLSHRSFECGRPLQAIFLVLGSMANMGGCIDWVAHHLKHHAHSDRDGDPHSPLDGFLHAYFGWILRGTPAERERYCRRLLEDRLVSFIDSTAAVWVVLGLAIPYAIAGFDGLLWGGLVRIAFLSQIAFAVNSVGHSLGTRVFKTGDESRNNWVLAVLGFGDGWHNNHHAFPAMAFHGMTWRQFDPSALLLRLLERAGLVWNVQRPPAAAVERRRLLVPARAD